MFSAALLIISLPATGSAAVLLSEIAWMGTDDSPLNEWVELYNFSTTPTDLAGWTLTSSDGAVVINLAGLLTPHGVGVLERSTDDTIPNITALQIYNGTLSDEGDTLTLKNAEGTVVDQALGGASWTGIGGRKTNPIKTAQRTRMGTWVTAAPTPGLDNAQVSDLTNIGGTVSTTTTSSPTVGGNLVVSRSRGGHSTKKSDFVVSMNASSSLYANKSTPFTLTTSKLNKSRQLSISHYWNFGDGETGTGKEVFHTFQFPGEYVVMVESSTTRSHVSTRLDVQVLPHALSLSTTTDGNITVTNISADEFSLDGYLMSGEDFKFVFPKNSILKSKAAITIARSRLKSSENIKIIDPDTFVVDHISLSN